MAVEKGFTKQLVENIRSQVSKAIKEQHDTFYYTITALLSSGHVLVEGMPGLGKTLMARSLAKAMDLDFKRVQFTSDLMPSDLLGTKIYNMNDHSFQLKKGPLFTNLFLADEINRTPPKTQSALLEVMEERSITIDGECYKLQEPFLVCATQNPIEYEGTYPLPEALTDRFMMKITVDYTSFEAEKSILQMYDSGFNSSTLESSGITAVCNANDFLKCQEEIKDVKVDIEIFDYIQKIIAATRKAPSALAGASPRGGIALLLCAKTFAAVSGRDFCIPDDIKELAKPTLRHRILLHPEAEIEGYKVDSVIEKILDEVKVPR